MSCTHPKSLLDLPLELHRNILSYAFEDATAADINFNLKTRIELCTNVECPPTGLRQLIERPDGSSDNYDVVGTPIEDTANPYNPPLFAPSTGALAMALKNAHEQLAYDLRFVLEKDLVEFEKRYDLHSREKWKIWWEENVGAAGNGYSLWLNWQEWHDPWYDWTTDDFYDDR